MCSVGVFVLSFPDFLDSTSFTLNCFNRPAWSKTKGTVNYFITMDTQPTQQQGEIQSHNYLVDYIRSNIMNEKKEESRTGVSLQIHLFRVYNS